MTYALADLPMLSGLDAARVRELEGLARHRRYPAGQVLCTEGDPAGELIVLLEGRVRASRAGTDGREAVLAAPSAPVAFDKTALLAGGPHRATLTAVTAVRVAYLPGRAVRELVATEPAVAARVLLTLAETVRALDERLADAVLLDVPARLAKWLVRRRGPVRLDGGQAGLAAEIGATRVSVNRALRAFERRGLVRLGRSEVTVLDRDALARIGGTP
ncbi:Crp/Fnr family transcriptional regulator [Nonomuraea sp. CA-218870]|uniref:Crp/Fnr family transcriptional regulator n=1 Tax=Nonomuraea sp. CA-218870 TaxID=3239998 RepID=UPI003D919DCC